MQQEVALASRAGPAVCGACGAALGETGGEIQHIHWHQLQLLPRVSWGVTAATAAGRAANPFMHSLPYCRRFAVVAAEGAPARQCPQLDSRLARQPRVSHAQTAPCCKLPVWGSPINHQPCSAGRPVAAQAPAGCGSARSAQRTAASRWKAPLSS